MKKQLLFILMIMLPLIVSAYDIEVKNADGVTIYYKYINNGTELEVTYRDYYEYSSSVVIPEIVTYMDNNYYVTSIGSQAFQGCSNLTSVTIPNSVKTIGSYAFEYCSSLTSITLPNSVTSIGDWVFARCTSLTSIAIPNNMTRIAIKAFAGCSGLTSVTIPNSVSNIGSSAFEGCTGLTSLTIPNSVTGIGSLAFSGCKSLQSISLPNAITGFGSGAFSGCSGLTSIVIPSSVTSIDSGVFGACSGLTLITIPNSVTTIGREAFGGCTSLTSITIPNSVTTIEENAFKGCSSLMNVKVLATTPPAANENSFSTYNMPLLVEKESVESYKSTFPWSKFAEIKEIGGEDIKSILIDGIYYNLKYDSFTAEVTQSPEKYNGNIYIPSSIFYNEKYYDVLSIADNAFLDNTELKDVGMSEGIKTIGSKSFSGCTQIEKISIPNSVISIGDKAFDGCSGLKKVTIGRNVKEIGSLAFAGCPKIDYLYVEASTPPIAPDDVFENYNLTLYVDDPYLTEYQATRPWSLFTNIESNYTTYRIEIDGLIYDFDLYNDLAIVVGRTSENYDVVIPANVTFKGKAYTVTVSGCTYLNNRGAFYDDQGILSYTDPYVEHISSANSGLCYNAQNLKRVSCPSLISIGVGYSPNYCAFANCSSLTDIDMPKLESIGDLAFMGCISLENIDLPQLKTLAGQVFYGLNLKTVNAPNLNKISSLDFANNSSLTSITLDNVISMGEKDIYYSHVGGAFMNCTSLKEISLSNIVHVNSSKQYSSDIAYGNFENCTALEKVTIGDKCEKIDYQTFKGCTSLNKIYCHALVPPVLDETAFDEDTYKNSTLYVHASCYNLYKKTENWKNFENIEPLEPMYKVKFIIDGEIYKEVMCEVGGVIDIITPPSIEGYTFSGWSEIPSAMPDNDVVVSGSFSVNQYNLIYTVNNEVYKVETVNYGTNITAIDAPKVEGYQFAYWENLPDIMPSHDVTVSAYYNVLFYHISFIIDGSVYMNKSVAYGSVPIAPEAPAKFGYTFDHWDNLPAKMPAEDIQVLGVYVANKYMITYMIDGEVFATEMVDYDSVINPPTVPNKDGHSFMWSSHPTRMPAYDITIYGNYTTGVNEIIIDRQNLNTYSIEGKLLNVPQKGVNIVRLKNGQTKKIVVK